MTSSQQETPRGVNRAQFAFVKCIFLVYIIVLSALLFGLGASAYELNLARDNPRAKICPCSTGLVGACGKKLPL